MEAVKDGDDGEKSGFRRWLYAARYAVAAVVTVLIVVVVVKAIKVVLRPESLQIWVVGGSISAWPEPDPSPPSKEAAKAVEFRLDLWAQNPSDRVRMYFVDIQAYLFDNSTSAASPEPGFDSMVMFRPGDIAAAQMEGLECGLQMSAKSGDMTPESFNVLYGGGGMSGVTLRLDGNLVTEVTSRRNKTHPTTYYCEQLLVGGGEPDDKSDDNKEKVICKEQRAFN